jgi:cytochrome b561
MNLSRHEGSVSNGVSAVRFGNSDDGYGAIPQALHWITVGLVLLAWTLGTFGDALPKGAARAAGLSVHIFAGLSILAVLLLRLLWRLADPPPPSEVTVLGIWLDRAARLAHYALYALVIATPVAGVVLQFARGDALPLFGISEMPSPWPADRAFARSVKDVHEVLANSLMILAAFHAAAALFHHWILRDRTLVRMLPRSTR